MKGKKVLVVSLTNFYWGHQFPTILMCPCPRLNGETKFKERWYPSLPPRTFDRDKNVFVYSCLLTRLPLILVDYPKHKIKLKLPPVKIVNLPILHQMLVNMRPKSNSVPVSLVNVDEKLEKRFLSFQQPTLFGVMYSLPFQCVLVLHLSYTERWYPPTPPRTFNKDKNVFVCSCYLLEDSL